MGFLSREQLKACGFQFVGKDVKISDKASIYGASRISIGDHSRIDDFCVVSAGEEGIEIGRYVHIAVFCSLMGKGRIVMKDFSGLSSRVSLYSSSDDYSGRSLTNPTVPDEFKKVHHGPVILGKHVIIGVGSAILPNVTIADGSAVGALSLVTKDVEGGIIVSGVPARKISTRKDNIFNLEQELAKKEGSKE
jgi:acetyltransferase-like isoleucine patch superfamily enzyme